MQAYKLLRVRRDGTIGSLFINRKRVLPVGEWMDAEEHQTKGFAFRPGWHAMAKPEAPHLSPKGRKWYRVQVSGVTKCHRPASQGGLWYLAKRMKIVGEL